MLLLASLLHASDAAFGELHGTVYDPSDALVPNVSVTLSNQATGYRRHAVSDEHGEYRFLLVPPGVYTVRFERESFRSQVAERVAVTVGQIAVFDVKLQLGAV